MAFDPQSLTLTGSLVRLEPLGLQHTSDLLAAAGDDEIWRYLPLSRPASEAEVAKWITDALAGAASGNEIPFAIVLQDSGRAVGSTRYLDIQRAHSALEIGWTWLGAEVQRTGVNTECKLLLLTHAFESLGAVRVQLKTDARNLRSQTAIERVGGVREGTLRKHRRLPDGFIRDSVYFSILDSEWPMVKARLLAR